MFVRQWVTLPPVRYLSLRAELGPDQAPIANRIVTLCLLGKENKYCPMTEQWFSGIFPNTQIICSSSVVWCQDRRSGDKSSNFGFHIWSYIRGQMRPIILGDVYKYCSWADSWLFAVILITPCSSYHDEGSRPPGPGCQMFSVVIVAHNTLYVGNSMNDDEVLWRNAIDRVGGDCGYGKIRLRNHQHRIVAHSLMSNILIWTDLFLYQKH